MVSSLVGGEQLDAYLRISSIAVAIWDYLWTLPMEYRLYTSQKSFRRMSRTCILFILNRYLSIAVIVMSNVGFLGSFSRQACNTYFLVTPCFKVFQTIIIQVIMAARAWHISRRKRWVGWTLLSIGLVFVIMEFWTNLSGRTALASSGRQNCISGNTGMKIAWIYYVVYIVFDSMTIGISVGYLVSYHPLSQSLGRIIRRLLVEGIGYFVVMTSVNVLNLLIYFSAPADTQTSAASLGYIISWAMGQRLLINHFASSEGSKQSLDAVNLEETNNVRAMRSQFEDRGYRLNLEAAHSRTDGVCKHDASTGRSYPDSPVNEEQDIGVSIHVERNVKFEHVHVNAQPDAMVLNEMLNDRRHEQLNGWSVDWRI